MDSELSAACGDVDPGGPPTSAAPPPAAVGQPPAAGGDRATCDGCGRPIKDRWLPNTRLPEQLLLYNIASIQLYTGFTFQI